MARGGRGGSRVARSRATSVRVPGNGSATYKNVGAVPGKTSSGGGARKNTVRSGLPNGAGSQSANWKA